MSHAKALYKNNMMGLPTKVSVFDDIAYDETGTRVSYSVKNNGTGIDYTEVGASGMVNPYYTPRSPNGLYPWALRNTYLYY